MDENSGYRRCGATHSFLNMKCQQDSALLYQQVPLVTRALYLLRLFRDFADLLLSFMVLLGQLVSLQLLAFASRLRSSLDWRARAQQSCHLNLERAVAVVHLCGRADRRIGFAGSHATTRRSSC